MVQDDLMADEFSFDTQFRYKTLLKSLDNADPQVRIAAIEELWNDVEREVFAKLCHMAIHDPDQKVRCQAISGLGRYVWEGNILDPEFDDFEENWFTKDDLDQVSRFLFDIYHDQSKALEERRRAVEALSFLSEPEVVNVIEALYARSEKQAKISALFAMGRNGHIKWEDVLAREMMNKDRDIQIEAIDAVGEMRAESLSKDLLRLTFAEDKDVITSAIFSLGQTGHPDAFDRLDELTLHTDPEIRDVADTALSEWLLFSQMGQQDDDFDEDDADWMI